MAANLVTPVLHPIDAVVAVPGSKSIANRALVCAALADGTSTLSNCPDGDDTEAMLKCLELLGIGARRDSVDSGMAVVSGSGGHLRPGPLQLATGLAGTTSRFVTALAALGPGPYTIDGDPPLRSRPMAPLHDALAGLGASVQPTQTWGHLPVTISGPLRATGAVDVSGDVSSQFLTALMLVGPYIAGGLRISITTTLVSRPYLELTKAVMAAFGHDDVSIDVDRIEVGAGRYSACDYVIEPDATSAGYPLAAAAICGGRVEVPGLTIASMQGDAEFCELLAEMGCISSRDAVSTSVRSGSRLRGIDIDMVDHSDLVPTVAAVAAFAAGPTRIRGVGFIRAKESDRLGDLCKEMRRLGACATETDDGLTIEPAELRGSSVDTHHDHRLAMSFGLIGLRVDGVEIDDPSVVSKSWPGYWDMLKGSAVSDKLVIAAFDVDGTLTTRDCVRPFLERAAGRRRLITSLLRRPLATLAAAARRDRDRFKEIIVGGSLRGKLITEVEAIGEQFAQFVLVNWLRPDTLRRLRWHQRAGHRTVIVSASLAAYLRPLALRLGIDDVLCTDATRSGDRYGDRLVGQNCRADEKRRRLELWMEERRWVDAEVWAYGDSIGDRELLARADHPVWVNGETISEIPDAVAG